jgi:hypothetical protein
MMATSRARSPHLRDMYASAALSENSLTRSSVPASQQTRHQEIASQHLAMAARARIVAGGRLAAFLLSLALAQPCFLSLLVAWSPRIAVIRLIHSPAGGLVVWERVVWLQARDDEC